MRSGLGDSTLQYAINYGEPAQGRCKAEINYSGSSSYSLAALSAKQPTSYGVNLGDAL